VEVRVADHRPLGLAEHDRSQRPRQPLGALGDLVATEPDETQRVAREVIGDREVGKPADGFAIVGNECVEQRRCQRDEIEAS
jgi:hypothetical protein